MLLKSASVLLVVAVTAGCGSASAPGLGPSQVVSQPRSAPARAAPAAARASRAALLVRCPALAPSWFVGQTFPAGVQGQVQQRRQLGLRSDSGYVRRLEEEAAAGSPGVNSSFGPVLDEQEQRVLVSRQQAVSRAEEVALRFLRRLPAGEAGELRAGDDRTSIVVQVTRDSAHAKVALQALVGPTARVDIEPVRYSIAELRRLAQRIRDLPQLHWSAVGSGGGDDRVEVLVRDHVDQARRLIATIADRCEFTVSQGAVVPAGGAGAAGTARPTSAQ